VNRSYDGEDDLHNPGSRDREISLGTTMILGIFFVLALLCAVFFGFGYSMGRRSAQPVVGAPEATTASDSTGSKPSPGSRAVATADGNGAAATIVDSTAPSNATGGKASPATAATRPQLSQSNPSTQPMANSAIKQVSMPRPATATTTPPAPVAIPNMGIVVVQVAAVSHQEDADVLMNALKKHGYNVAVRQEPQDKLLHVQVGPFTSKKDAEAIRQRLLTDGYNAIVK
jgi:cell division septation protein DedD